MDLTELEAEVVAGFLSEHWSEFVEFADGVVSESTLHKIAEKFKLESAS